MSEIDLTEVKSEAKRFLGRIAAFEAHVKTQERIHADHYACPERAAIRRASLDLTRALARLRQR